MKTRSYKLQIKHLAVIVIAMLLSSQLSAQKNAIGVRLGTDPGITYKRYFAGNGGMELMLTTASYRGLVLTGLYEWHLPFAGAPGLFGYLGVGGHVGTFNHWVATRRYRNGHTEVIYVDGSGPSFGVDGIMGLEYRIPGAPLTIGLDIKPGIDIYRDAVIGTFNGAFSFRYRF